MATFCTDCHRTDHHRPDCPQMSFPSGERRDVPGAPGPHDGIPLGDEMAGIFAGGVERMLKRHLADVKAGKA